MLTIISKILRVHKNIIPVNTIDYKQTEIITLGKKIHNKIIHLFHGSLAIRQIDGGSDNACEQELVALSNSFYDIERFGIHFVASPRHADMLLVT